MKKRIDLIGDRRLLLLFLGLTLIFMLLQFYLNARLNTPAAPQDIVSFELAGTVEKAAAIMQSWELVPAENIGEDKTGIDLALRSIWWDYLFLVTYGGFIALLVLRSGRYMDRIGWKLGKLGPVLAIGTLVAAFCDLVENTGMLTTLYQFQKGENLTAAPVSIAYWFASIKFFLLGLAILYILTGGLVFFCRFLFKVKDRAS